VAALFAAVPARRKFLKAAATEWTHVADWLARAALARPDVHVDVVREDRPAWSWPATQDRLARVAAVLSEREAEGLVPAELERDGLRLRGFVSRPDAHRRSADGLYLYVNGRPVRDRLLRHALLEAYRDLLPRGRFPTALLELELAPEAVDVNVHPAKWEVRFADPQTVHRAVSATVRRAIEARGWLVGAPGAGAAPSAAAAREAVLAPGSAGPAASAWGGARPAPAAPAAGGDWLFAERPAAPAHATEAAPVPRFGDLRLLGQLLGSYLVLEDKAGLLLVDQHAAHERVLYERLRAAWLAGGVERQLLLVAAPIELEAASRAALEAAGEGLARLGFELEPFGAGAVLARAVPALLAEQDPAALVRGLGDELRGAALAEGEGAPAGPASVRLLESADRLFASLACHAARRAGDVLPTAEQRALLEALDTIPWAPTCPHGRPVAVPFGLPEIERRFGRRA
jgi:DNA mismatch repair protein MutL